LEFAVDAAWSSSCIGRGTSPASLSRSALLANEVFSVKPDFGSSFDGSRRWLGITVQAGTDASETLAPRERIAV